MNSGTALESPRAETARTTRRLDGVWAHPGLAWGLAVGLAAGPGLASGWLMPRGPVTTLQALATMVVAMSVGLGVGLTLGTRWSLLLAPAAFAGAFELGRLAVDGPTVDGIHPTSMYGIIAFVAGRGAMVVLVLTPLVTGALLGVGLAGRLGRRTIGAGGWSLVTLLTLLLLVVGVLVARPASTAPIVGTPAGGVAEFVTVPIGGVDQTMLIRGMSTEAPVLLFLAGGPGGTEIGAMRADVGLEQDFVVVTWDQRGTGKSYAAIDPVEDLTLARMVGDTVEITNYLRDRFDEDRIYLVGNSWGTTLGVLAAQQHPELYHAFVGTGQMVSQRETDIMFWEDTLAWAEETGNQGLVKELQRIGSPPYDDLLDYEPGVFAHVYDWGGYPTHDGTKELPYTLFVPEYTVMERLNSMRGLLDTFSALYPQLQELDFRTDVPSLDVPFYMVTGTHEARGRAVPADEWFNMLDAPNKERVVFDESGHRPSFEQPDLFAELMRRVVEDTQ
jgi:proline iminopeptidase